MAHYLQLDALVQKRLREWPQRPPGLIENSKRPASWLRGRPSESTGFGVPYLKIPGSTRMRTLPDGLWINFGGTAVDPFVDIFAIEACSTMQNLLDKRSRFAPSTHSLVVVCPVPWLLAPVSPTDPTPRWRCTGIIAHEPSLPLSVPVRDLKVMYALRRVAYREFAGSQVPHAHEFFVPMEALTEERAHENPAMRALVSRASISGNFLCIP